MKKIICLALSLLMLMSLFSVSVFAEEEEKSELIRYEKTNNKETEHFVLNVDNYGSLGWYGGDNLNTLTIKAKDSNIIITRIEAVIGAIGRDYGLVGVSGGKKRETGSVSNGDTVHIDNINSTEFSFRGGISYVTFEDITVYYVEKSETIEFEETKRKETEHFILTTTYCGSTGWCGGDNTFKLTITSRDSNIIITRIKAVVGDYGWFYGGVGVNRGDKREKGSVSNGNTVHIDNINSTEFSFSGGSENINFKDITVYYKESNNTGFTLSQGNIWIIAGIGVVAIVAIAVVVAKKKKNPAPAEGEITVAENTEKTEE